MLNASVCKQSSLMQVIHLGKKTPSIEPQAIGGITILSVIVITKPFTIIGVSCDS